VPSVIRHRPAGNPDTATLGNRLARPDTPEQAGLLAKEGWNLYAAGKVEEARDKLAAASAGGAGVWTDYALALAEFTLHHPEEAARIWQRVRTAQPDYEPVYFDLADAYLQMGRSSDALSVLRDAPAAGRTIPKPTTPSASSSSAAARDDAIDSFSRRRRSQRRAWLLQPRPPIISATNSVHYNGHLRPPRALSANADRQAIEAQKCPTLGGTEKDAATPCHTRLRHFRVPHRQSGNRQSGNGKTVMGNRLNQQSNR
jgi:tetratricopeptide (TPR) repeat protein